jgi:hypothetical protein
MNLSRGAERRGLSYTDSSYARDAPLTLRTRRGVFVRLGKPTMNAVNQTQPVPEISPPIQLDPELATDEQRIGKHLGPAFRITPIGSRRFRCNKYSGPSALHPTGRLAETLVLRIVGTRIEQMSDHEARSGRCRPW